MGNEIINMGYPVYNAIMGLVVGDAVGLPYEGKERNTFRCEAMTGFGTYKQPPGTWSDNSSMTLATVASLVKNDGKINLGDMMKQFRSWLYKGKFTPWGKVISFGSTARYAIARYSEKENNVYSCGGRELLTNDAGSLSRILPLAFIETTGKDIFEVSGLTHAHEVSQTACMIYVTYAKKLYHGVDRDEALVETLHECEWCLTNDFVRLKNIKNVSRDDISNYIYVVSILEAALWCFLTSNDYRECILKAVNLGNDSDTTAAIAGGLAGLYWGVDGDGIPLMWLEDVAGTAEIGRLCEKFNEILNKIQSD